MGGEQDIRLQRSGPTVRSSRPAREAPERHRCAAGTWDRPFRGPGGGVYGAWWKIEVRRPKL